METFCRFISLMILETDLRSTGGRGRDEDPSYVITFCSLLVREDDEDDEDDDDGGDGDGCTDASVSLIINLSHVPQSRSVFNRRGLAGQPP